MKNNKRYYWLKLKEDFFNEKRIKRLRKISGGDTYTIIYLKLLLLSLKSNGKLCYDEVESDFIKELALTIDESEDDVGVTLTFLLKQKMIEELVEDKEYFLTEIPRLIGSETAWADKKRKYRELKREDNVLKLSSLCPPNVRQDKDIDKDIEIDIEIDKDIDKELDLYRKTYGKYKNVYLNDEEYIELKNILGIYLEDMIERLQDVMMLSLAELVECRDETTGGHVKRTAEYVRILANELVEAGVYSDILTPEYVKDIIKSAPLHDIGKIGINDATLLKMGSLDEDEFEYMKKHVELGAISLQKMINETEEESFLYTARDMAHYHHEKWDGTGYPKGLKGEEIPISARIMAIADVYDALTTKRPYKEPFSHEDTVKIIIEGRGKGFDPNIVDVFKEINYKFEMVKF